MNTSPDEYNVRNLTNLLSVEFLAAAVLAAVAVGILMNNVSATDATIKKHLTHHAEDMNTQQQRTNELSREMGQMQRAVDVSENNIEHIKETVGANKEQLDEILRLLRANSQTQRMTQ